MITRLEIENFKGFGDESQCIEIAPITLLFGANSAGKSSFFQALFYLREIFETSFATPGEMSYFAPQIELGGFRNVVNSHNTRKNIRFKLSIDTTEHDEEGANYSFGCRPLSLELIIKNADGIRAFVEVFRLELDGDRIVDLNATWNSEFRWFDISVHFHFENIANSYIELPPNTEGRWTTFYRYGGAVPMPQDPMLAFSMQRNGEHVSRDYLDFLKEVDLLLVESVKLARESFNDLLFIGPVRSVPTAEFSAQLKPARARWSSGLAGWDALHFSSEKDLLLVNQWLGPTRLNTGIALELQQLVPISILQTGYESSLTPRIRIRPLVKDSEEISQASLRVQDVGFGISQLLPLISALIVAAQKCVVVEQPEIHLHPRLQTGLGDLLICTCIGEDAKKRTIIETHSEHLILRILRRIRETTENELPDNVNEVTPDDIAVNYFNQSNGCTTVKLLRINEEGEFIDTWPHGFFDERIGELYG